jgi:hypothetical protein
VSGPLLAWLFLAVTRKAPTIGDIARETARRVGGGVGCGPPTSCWSDGRRHRSTTEITGRDFRRSCRRQQAQRKRPEPSRVPA